MAFQLTIRHNLEAAAAKDAEAGEVRGFAATRVRVGSGPDCECRLATGELAPLHFTIAAGTAEEQWRLLPEPGCELYMGKQPVAAPAELLSGAELRVGHWTFRFQKDYGGPGACRRRPDHLALVAKLLVGMILVLEIFVVSWLPRRLQAASIWEAQIAKEQTLLLLDNLRARSIYLTRKTENKTAAAAGTLLAAEMDSLAVQVRRAQRSFSRDQWRGLHKELVALEETIRRLEAGQVLRPLPDPDLAAAFRVLTQKSGSTE